MGPIGKTRDKQEGPRYQAVLGKHAFVFSSGVELYDAWVVRESMTLISLCFSYLLVCFCCFSCFSHFALSDFHQTIASRSSFLYPFTFSFPPILSLLSSSSCQTCVPMLLNFIDSWIDLQPFATFCYECEKWEEMARRTKRSEEKRVEQSMREREE